MHGLRTAPIAGARCQQQHALRGPHFVAPARRRMRPACVPIQTVAMVKNRKMIRDPDDSPMRDGNRDRLYGLLTERACSTLVWYTFETNQEALKYLRVLSSDLQNLSQWLQKYFHENPIPRKGEWGEISGDEFLLKMMMSPPQTIENPYTFERLTIEPRNLAMRILEIRKHLAQEFAQDLKWVTEENADLMKEAVVRSLKNSLSAADSTPEPEIASATAEGGGKGDGAAATGDGEAAQKKPAADAPSAAQPGKPQEKPPPPPAAAPPTSESGEAKK